MKKDLTSALVIFVLAGIISGCVQNKTQNKPSNTVQIANPASTNCIEKGGELEIKDSESGQYGVCKFNDGSSCEEWAFFRNECKKGEKF